MVTTGGPRRAAPERRPLRSALALALVTLGTVLMSVLGLVAAALLAGSGIDQGLSFDDDGFAGQELAIWLVVVLLVAVGLLLVGIALELASIVLGILVVVRGDGKLRLGAILLLIATAGGLFFSLSVEGTIGSETVTEVLAIVTTVLEVLRWGVLVTGLVILALGIREARAARAGPSAVAPR